MGDSCSICGRPYSDTIIKVSGHNQCRGCHARLKRERRKQKKEQDIKQHLETFPHDVNYGMKPTGIEPFPEWYEWKKENPRGTFVEYLLAKKEYFEENKIEIVGEDAPISRNQPNLCYRVQTKIRKSIKMSIPELMHLSNCKECGSYLARHPNPWGGANPWSGS